ncbi:MAG: esterase/lipase family protein [Gammaproteobacteria bacterium]
MPKETVILVHGIWTNGLEMSLLGARLEHAGFAPRRFSYHSVLSTPVENALALQSFAGKITSPVVHYVCHSLGGLVVRHLFHNFPGRVPGRVVTLGTPHVTSRAAGALTQYFPGRVVFGKSLKQGLLGNAPPWRGHHELGVIAGTLRLGMGLLVPGIPQPNDGTVAVAETMLAGRKDHITVPASHTGMLFSRVAADQTIHFLRNGYFLHG